MKQITTNTSPATQGCQATETNLAPHAAVAPPTIVPSSIVVRGITAADRLENARQQVRFALCEASEGEAAFDTLDAISRALTVAGRDLEELTIQIAVMERKAVNR